MSDSIMVAASLELSLIDWAEGNNDAALLIDRERLRSIKRPEATLGQQTLSESWREFTTSSETLAGL